MERISIPESTEKKFWEKVNKNGPIIYPHLDKCWIWTAGRRRPNSYGDFKPGKKFQAREAHRFSYLLKFREIPFGLFVCHHCDNPPCVNPDHLFLGTAQDNADDCKRKNRTTKGDKSWVHNNPYITRGENNGRAKLKAAQVLEIRNLYDTGEFSQAGIARMFSLDSARVGEIVNGKMWKSLPLGKRRGPNRKRLTLSQAEEIRRKYSTGNFLQAELAKEYGVSNGSVYFIVNGKTFNQDGIAPIMRMSDEQKSAHSRKVAIDRWRKRRNGEISNIGSKIK